MNKCFIGSIKQMPNKAFELKRLTPHSKEWMEAIVVVKKQ
ncbi:hypothetical protein L293_1180 [Acinetobacter gyllenbergii CIP 110306 = MTCC 11365]|nr:hypothetical protein L293_1180 [Acinetobacter gyllenbergii CIP 110306 = MTCC 11365]